MEGKKELLGIWIGKNEGANFWMQVVTELKNRYFSLHPLILFQMTHWSR